MTPFPKRPMPAILHPGDGGRYLGALREGARALRERADESARRHVRTEAELARAAALLLDELWDRLANGAG